MVSQSPNPSLREGGGSGAALSGAGSSRAARQAIPLPFSQRSLSLLRLTVRLTGARLLRRVTPILLISTLLPSRVSAVGQERVMSCHRRGQRHLDAVVFGDEPAGVMTALELSRTLPQLGGVTSPHIALVTDADIRLGLGGTISRAGLAYLDRNQVPSDMAGLLPPFAPSSELYARFLRLTGVQQIAVDPRRASRALGAALRRAGITVLPKAQLMGAASEGHHLCLMQSRRYGSIGADLFIDASIGADLAHQAGVPFRPGLGPRSLSHESIALGWIFEVQGLNLRSLQALEERFTRRLMDRRDFEAQSWLSPWRQAHQDSAQLPALLLDERGAPRLLYSSTSDSADQRSPALAIVFHGEERIPPGLMEGQPVLDLANVAILRDRLSLNALLFLNSAERNRRVLAGGSRPLPEMLPVAKAVTHFFLRHGARRVIWMPELYVRSADQIAHPQDTLSADLMARGGVPTAQALGTFTYNLDFRGGLAGVIPRPRPTFNFGFRHTLPRERDNLAVLGPSSGYGGLGEGAGRIIELNVSVGQGLAIASALALRQHSPLASVDPTEVSQRMPFETLPYGRASPNTLTHLLLRRMLYALVQRLPSPLNKQIWEWL